MRDTGRAIPVRSSASLRAGTSGAAGPAHAEAAPPASAGPAQQPLLAHGLERRLVGDANAGRFAQRVGNASVSVSEPGFLAYPRYGRPLGRLPVRGRVRLVAAIGGARHPDELRERGERMFPPRRLRRLVLPPAAERAVAEAAVRFKISTSISRRAHRRSSVSSPAGSFLLRPVSCLRAVAHAVLEGEGPAVALAAEIGFDDAKLEIPGIAAVPPRPVHGPDAALVDSLSKASRSTSQGRTRSAAWRWPRRRRIRPQSAA